MTWRRPVSHKLRIAYLVHSLRSDWNNGNAHFLRGLIRALGTLGHDAVVFEPRDAWFIQNLLGEDCGREALDRFAAMYPDIRVLPYDPALNGREAFWRRALREFDIVILHEWNPPALAHTLLALRDEAGFKLLFHDTHHRASSSPEQIRLFSTDRFDGVLAFGEALRDIYRECFGIARVWTLHEAADTTVFRPDPGAAKRQDVVWIGNWGDNERSSEIRRFLLKPASGLRETTFTIFGVRYPDEGICALRESGVRYGGYLPNLQAPAMYAASKLTVHIPRQQYATQMIGIPTIRVFEALACGIPLLSAPWADCENLFPEACFLMAKNGEEMESQMRAVLSDAALANELRENGMKIIHERHSCRHRVSELLQIYKQIRGESDVSLQEPEAA